MALSLSLPICLRTLLFDPLFLWQHLSSFAFFSLFSPFSVLSPSFCSVLSVVVLVLWFLVFLFCSAVSSHFFPSWYLSFPSLLSPPLPHFSLTSQTLPLPETPSVSAMSPPTTWWKKIKSGDTPLQKWLSFWGGEGQRAP